MCRKISLVSSGRLCRKISPVSEGLTYDSGLHQQASLIAFIHDDVFIHPTGVQRGTLRCYPHYSSSVRHVPLGSGQPADLAGVSASDLKQINTHTVAAQHVVQLQNSSFGRCIVMVSTQVRKTCIHIHNLFSTKISDKSPHSLLLTYRAGRCFKCRTVLNSQSRGYLFYFP